MVGRDAPILQPRLTLLTLLVEKISLGKLVDNLVLESSCTHGRLQNLQFKKFCSLALVVTHVIDDRLQRVFHRAAREHLRCIVRSRLLAVATIQTIHESSLGQYDRLTRLRVGEHFADVEVAHATVWHQESAILWFVCLVDLDIVLLGIEAAECEQTLVNATQLVHTQVGITDATAVVFLFRE